MPPLIQIHHLSLTVTDLARSVAWYCDVLGFVIDAEVTGDAFRRTRLRQPGSDVVVTLTRHDTGVPGPFDERAPGLDHVSFRVPAVTDVERITRRFEEHGVTHSEIKRSERLAMVTVRDPDGIQLEVMALTG